MKKKYQAPEAMEQKFNSSDVITVSITVYSESGNGDMLGYDEW